MSNTIRTLADLREDAMKPLRRIKADAKSLISQRSTLADIVWYARCNHFTWTNDAGVTMPDYNGRSKEYKAWHGDLLTAAGFVPPKNATRTQERAVEKARNEVSAAIRYEVRKLADDNLNRTQLLAAGFSHSTALGKNQTLSEGDGVKAKPLAPVSTSLTNLDALIAQVIGRKADIGQMSVLDRQAAAQRFERAARALLAVLKPDAKAVKAAAADAASQAETQAVIDAQAEAAAEAKAEVKG